MAFPPLIGLFAVLTANKPLKMSQKGHLKDEARGRCIKKLNSAELWLIPNDKINITVLKC